MTTRSCTEKIERQACFNYQYIDDLFDRTLAHGVRLFVELGFVPAEIPYVKNTTFWWHAHGSPPTDNARWGRACPAYGATLG
jgi:xylan 1,4-beta-xylosidase